MKFDGRALADGTTKLIVGLCALSVALVIWMILRSVYVDDSGIWVRYEHLWADLPIHIAIANIFATTEASSWFKFHPMFAQQKLNYPFVADMLSGLLIKTGMAVNWAMILPQVAVFSGLIFMWLKIARQLRMSYVSTASFILLLIYSSGFGAFEKLLDSGWSAFDSSLVRFEQYQWYSGNLIDGILLPQRTYGFGMLCASIVISGILTALQEPLGIQRGKLVLLGMLVGLTPIIHAHTSIALAVLFGVVLLIDRRWTLWGWVMVPAGVVGALVYTKFVQSAGINAGFMKLNYGWTATGWQDWFWMWLRIFGLVVPLSIVALPAWYRLDKGVRILGAWSLILFALGNLVLFQPVPWDNSKIFFYSYFGLCLVLCWGFDAVQSQFRGMGWIGSVLLVISTFSGCAELIRVNLKRSPMMVASQSDIEVGRRLAQSFDRRARFLVAPTHNHWVMTWAARPIVAGFTGWLGNFGVDGSRVHDDLKKIFKEPMEARDLINKYEIDYAVIGPDEMIFGADPDKFVACCALVMQHNAYRVFDLRALAASNGK
jgi:hypothetical protein